MIVVRYFYTFRFRAVDDLNTVSSICNDHLALQETRFNQST